MLACRDCFWFLTFAHSEVIGVKRVRSMNLHSRFVCCIGVCVCVLFCDWMTLGVTVRLMPLSNHLMATPSAGASLVGWIQWFPSISLEIAAGIHQVLQGYRYSGHQGLDKYTLKHFETPNTCSDLKWNVINNLGGNKLATVQHDTLTPFLFMFCRQIAWYSFLVCCANQSLSLTFLQHHIWTSKQQDIILMR